jgi:TolA-binding protein
LNIGDKANARLILKELIKKYPNTTESQLAAQKLSQIK